MPLDPDKLKQPPLPLYQVLKEEYENMGGTFAPGARADYDKAAEKAEKARELWCRATKRAAQTSSDEDDSVCYQQMRILRSAEDECLRVLYREFHRVGRSALCVSGGGIRSATFSLGVMSKLAEVGVLGHFD